MLDIKLHKHTHTVLICTPTSTHSLSEHLIIPVLFDVLGVHDSACHRHQSLLLLCESLWLLCWAMTVFYDFRSALDCDCGKRLCRILSVLKECICRCGRFKVVVSVKTMSSCSVAVVSVGSLQRTAGFTISCHYSHMMCNLEYFLSCP